MANINLKKALTSHGSFMHCLAVSLSPGYEEASVFVGWVWEETGLPVKILPIAPFISHI